MSINITLKPTYPIPIIGIVGATAQQGFTSGRIPFPFRINGVEIIFGSDHMDAALHYLMTDETDNVSAANLTTGDNILPPASQTPYFIGHNMIRLIRFIKDFPEGDLYLKCHVVNNNLYAIQVNVMFIVEEI